MSEKVDKLKIGYSINPLDDSEIVEFIKSLTKEDILKKSQNAAKIDKRECLNVNDEFFLKL